jgi:membrane associated rhomboid family serine protease
LRYSYQPSKQTAIWVLIAVNFLIFIITQVNQQFELNLALSLYTFQSQPWTILTCMFVHADFWHILFNMIALYFFGTFLLQLVGSGRFLLVYFVSGIIGNLMFLLFAHYGIASSPYDYIVGASGAIYGLGGALVVIMPKLRVYIFGIIPMPLWVAIIIGFLIIIPNVAWQAHLGGLVVGLIAGYYFRRQYVRRQRRW